jgi:hypothetical protein
LIVAGERHFVPYRAAKQELKFMIDAEHATHRWASRKEAIASLLTEARDLSVQARVLRDLCTKAGDKKIAIDALDKAIAALDQLLPEPQPTDNEEDLVADFDARATPALLLQLVEATYRLERFFDKRQM